MSDQNKLTYHYLHPAARDLANRHLGLPNEAAWAAHCSEIAKMGLKGHEIVAMRSLTWTFRRVETELAQARNAAAGLQPAISYGAVTTAVPAIPTRTAPDPDPIDTRLTMEDVANLPARQPVPATPAAPAPATPAAPAPASGRRGPVGLGLPGQKWGIQPL